MLNFENPKVQTSGAVDSAALVLFTHLLVNDHTKSDTYRRFEQFRIGLSTLLEWRGRREGANLDIFLLDNSDAKLDDIPTFITDLLRYLNVRIITGAPTGTNISNIGVGWLQLLRYISPLGPKYSKVIIHEPRTILISDSFIDSCVFDARSCFRIGYNLIDGRSHVYTGTLAFAQKHFLKVTSQITSELLSNLLLNSISVENWLNDWLASNTPDAYFSESAGVIWLNKYSGLIVRY